MAALVGAMVELGYGVSWRVYDARHFGVPQRRRRVFIVGLRSGPDDPGGRAAALRAAEVLAVGTRCGRHPPTGIEAWEEPAAGAGERPAGLGYVADIAGSLSIGGHVGIQPNGQDAWTGQLISTPPDPGGVREADGLARRLDDRERLAPTMNSNKTGGWRFDADQVEMLVAAGDTADDPLLPAGLDSNRYRCCGNGVVSNVAEWIGRRLIEVLDA